MSLISNAQIQSIQKKIKKLAKDRGVLSHQLMTIFLLERAAARLMADGKLQKNLVFKGGYVGVRVYNSPRYTTDLDAVICGMSKDEATQKIKVAMAIDPSILKRGWATAVSAVKDAPQFEVSFANVVNSLKILDI